MSRPTSLTPEVQARIVSALEQGCYLSEAAEVARVDIATVHRWMQRGATGEQPFCGFRDAVKAAKAGAVEFYVGVVKRAAEGGNWQAAMTWLERTNPRRWGKRDPTRKPPVTNFMVGSATEALRLMNEMRPALEEQAALEAVNQPAMRALPGPADTGNVKEEESR